MTRATKVLCETGEAPVEVDQMQSAGVSIGDSEQARRKLLAVSSLKGLEDLLSLTSGLEKTAGRTRPAVAALTVSGRPRPRTQRNVRS
jgi:hypothetical protein